MDNLHQVCEILEGLEDDAEAALTNLDQSKVFDCQKHLFQVIQFSRTVLIKKYAV